MKRRDASNTGTMRAVFALGVTIVCMVSLTSIVRSADAPEVFEPDQIGRRMERRASGSLKVGMASVNIDPTWPEYIPYGKHEEVDAFYGGPNCAKAVVFQMGELTVAWVELDVIGLPIQEAEFIKRMIASETGVAREHIVLGATHNHSYPRVRDRIRDWLAEKSAEAVKEALSGLLEARVGVGHRVLRSDLVNNREKVDGATMTDLYVMRIDDAEGMARGVVFNFGAHATMMTKSWSPDRTGMIGPDWPGYVRETIEGKTKLGRLYSAYAQGGDGPADLFTVFAQGACGHQVGLGQGPTVEDLDGQLASGTEIFVDTIVRNIMEMIPGIETASQNELVFRWKVVGVPFSERIPEDHRKGRPAATLLQALFLGDTVIATFPGELVADLGLRFQQHSGIQNSLIVGYANDSIGYIVSEAEALEAATYAGRGSMFGPERGRILTEEAIRLANPDYQPGPRFDRGVFGSVRGKVDYDGKANLVVAVMDLPRGPDYGATNWGKRAWVGPDGRYEIPELLPGRKFLYVVETEKDTPELKRWEGDQRLLTYGIPVPIRAGAVTEGADIRIRMDQLVTEVKSLRLDSETLSVAGNTISGHVQIGGKLAYGEQVIGGLYPFGVPYRNDLLRLSNPTVTAQVEGSGAFAFSAVPPGRYRVGFQLDVNENGLIEPGIDVVSGLSAEVLEVE
ncbi:MAG: hypothetical protein V1800_16115 [Candidatus Latescibacterota bacterium]